MYNTNHFILVKLSTYLDKEAVRLKFLKKKLNTIDTRKAPGTVRKLNPVLQLKGRKKIKISNQTNNYYKDYNPIRVPYEKNNAYICIGKY